MNDKRCAHCGYIMQEDDTDCLIEYLYKNNKLNHIKLVSAED